MPCSVLLCCRRLRTSHAPINPGGCPACSCHPCRWMAWAAKPTSSRSPARSCPRCGWVVAQGRAVSSVFWAKPTLSERFLRALHLPPLLACMMHAPPPPCLPQALRDWPAYKDCRKTVDDFLEIIPLLQALTHKSIRERCGGQGQETSSRSLVPPHQHCTSAPCGRSAAQHLLPTCLPAHPARAPAGTGSSCRRSRASSSTWRRMCSSCSTCWRARAC